MPPKLLYADTAEIAEGEERLSLIFSMAVSLLVSGYREVHARVHTLSADAAGLRGLIGPPPIIFGSEEDHRPDLIARGPDTGRTLVLLDAVPENLATRPEMILRWDLWNDCRIKHGWEVHFVVPGHSVERMIRKRWNEKVNPNHGPNKFWNVGEPS